jgi:hypothetical protein
MMQMRPNVQPPQPSAPSPMGGAPPMARPAMPQQPPQGGSMPPPGMASGGMPMQQNPQMAQQAALANALRGQQGGLRPISQGMSMQHPMGGMNRMAMP